MWENLASALYVIEQLLTCMEHRKGAETSPVEWQVHEKMRPIDRQRTLPVKRESG